MKFERSIHVDRPPADVFAFLRDKDEYLQAEDSPVLVLEKLTPGPPGVGTRYREVLQMLPLVKGEILSQITRFEPPSFLEEDFEGAGMAGHLAYEFAAEGDGTRLIQRESIGYKGLLSLLEPIIGFLLLRKIEERLEDIRAELERG
jgi:hypothetical protein